MREDSYTKPGREQQFFIGICSPSGPCGWCVSWLRWESPLSSGGSDAAILRVLPLSRLLFTDLQTHSVSCKLSFPGEIASRQDGISHLPVSISAVLYFYLFFFSALSFLFIWLSLSPLVYKYHESGGIHFLVYQCFLSTQSRDGTCSIYKLPSSFT